MDTQPYEMYVGLPALHDLWRCTTAWQPEQTVRAAGVALELTAHLITATLATPDPGQQHTERLERLMRNLHEQFALLDRLLTDAEPWPGPNAPPSSETALRGLAAAATTTPRLLKRLVSNALVVLDDLPFALGLAPTFNLLRQQFGAPPLSDHQRLTIPYDAWIQPPAVAALFAQRMLNSADWIFATVHQITECWLYLAHTELAAAVAATERHDWPVATAHLDQITAIVRYLADHILLLETMLPADYHPLRVRLREASGAQSRQMHELRSRSSRLLDPVLAALHAEHTSLLEVYHQPAQAGPIYGYLESLTSLETELAHFYFTHYRLAIRVLGTESFGTLGYEVRTLVDRFVKPLFPALDAVRGQQVVISDLAYSHLAGTLVSELLPASLPAPHTPAAVDPAIIMAQLDRFWAALEQRNTADWLALFSPSGWLEDPVGARPYQGHGLGLYLRNFHNLFDHLLYLRWHLTAINAAHGSAQASWSIEAQHRSIPLTLSGTMLFHFAANGDLQAVQISHDPAAIAERLLQLWSQPALVAS